MSTSKKSFKTLILLIVVQICTFSASNNQLNNQADVIIVGGTPGGIAAALAAARGGRTVTLVEYHDHIGGMMAGGLGKCDIEDREMIGGLFKEYVDRVYAYYVKKYGKDNENVKLCKNGYYFEPSVAELIFEEMLNEQPTIKVLKGWRLKSTKVINNSLTAIEIINRQSGNSQVLNGKVFIDATYEGDLFATAGAEFRIGRESRDEFGEPHAGVIYYDYQSKKILPGTTGESDNRLPAYTYRLCLTTDPENAYRLTNPPAEYNRLRYLGYFDDLKAGRLAGPKVFKPGRGYNPAHFNTLVRALSVTKLPNNKTDVNINPRPLGFPFPEENKGYIEGDDIDRQRIRKNHRNLTLGLIWFLQNDQEVPVEHRKLANELNLAKDEFIDNDYFPFQLYIREARRLVGEYTLTEKDITGDDQGSVLRHYYDNIAIGEFPIDSFPCRKKQPGDTIVLEGYLGMLDHITQPYEIPYRIMIPKKIDGLIVPVAASTTHVGFSSIRMEPTWMALGQAAGVAAAIVSGANIKPRNVPIKKLQSHLLLQGQVISHTKVNMPHPEKNPNSQLMLEGKWVPNDPHKIDFNILPRIKSKHVVVSDVRETNGVNQHNYLVYHAGKFWVMWSDGPGVEDRVGQRVAFATSTDGLDWSDAKYITPYPPNSGTNSPFYNTRSDKGFRYISRGFWQRGEELLALVSLDEADKFFGPSLQLRAFRLDPDNETWEDIGLVYDNTINNFPPKLLPNGEWMMTRRTHDRNVYMLTGGVESFDQWETYPVVSQGESELAPEEPYWWVLPDRNLLALFRDNAWSGFLFRSFSIDHGHTWSKPVRTNFPDARSKFSGLQLSDGRYVLVSNPNPKKRDPLVLSISDDGVVFNKMGYLIGGKQVDYPHIIEHNGYLFVAFSGEKQSVEVLKIKISELDTLEMPTEPLVDNSYIVPDIILTDDRVSKDPSQMDAENQHLLIHKMIEIENVRLSYVIRPGNGPTLILIPGSFSDANQWNEVVPVLGKNLNIILVEVRGHGKSWPPLIDGTIEQLAKDILLVADNEELSHFYVGGHSIGGMIAKEVGRSWPQRVKGVISIEGWTHWRASRDAFNGDMYSTLTPEQQKKRLKAREMGAGHWTKEQRSDFASIWRKWEKGVEFLQNTDLPIIEIYGDRGKKYPSLKQLYIPDRPNIEVHWIDNASHSLPLERPSEIAIVINDFIKKIESGKK